MWPDLINGGFELIGAYFTWRNFVQLRRDRHLAGVYWPTTAFFAAWGLWNLIYYPALGQWASFAGGVLLVAGNVAWVALAIRLLHEAEPVETFFKQLLCFHRKAKTWQIQHIEWDGEVVVRCARCGAIKRRQP